jgi:predicted Zn-dependent protease
VALLLCAGLGYAQVPAGGVPGPLAYPEPESAAVWRSLAATYVRKAVREEKLDKDPVLNARIDAVMAAVGAAVATVDPRFADAAASWKAILIEGFGRGAAAFPGETILVDAAFVRNLSLSDDELALILSHEAAHVVARHASAKLSFMAEFLGKEKVPTARTALLEFLAKDSYATEFQPKARQQEREADTIGAAIFFASGYDLRRALTLFDKLADMESRATGRAGLPGQVSDTHDSAATRKQIIATAISELQALQARNEQR